MTPAVESRGTRWPRSIYFVLVISAIATVGSIIEAWDHSGWKAATAVTALLNLSWLVFSLIFRNEFTLALWLCGLVAGIAELWTDCGVVHGQILVYSPGGPFIACSPLYMPFGWATELAAMGYIARFLLLHLKLRLPVAMLVSAVIGASQLPLSEYLAKSAYLWQYHNVRMVFGTVPYLIICSEFLVALPLPLIAIQLHRVRQSTPGGKISLWWAVLLGLALGLWIWIASMISLALYG